MIDGHSQIEDHPGEDDFLRTIFSNLKKNENQTIKKMKSKNNLNYFLKLSGQPGFKKNIGFDKWKKLYKLDVQNKKMNFWSGNQPESEGHVQDYQDLVPKINYGLFHKSLKKNLNKKNFNLKKKNFFDYFYNYLEASRKLSQKTYKLKKNVKYTYRITGSGLRRDLFFLFERCENIICLCPIRKFETFYFSYTKSRFKHTEIKQKELNEFWEHWRHKVVDYLILKEKYPKKIFFIKYEDLINNKNKTIKKISNLLGVKSEKIMKVPTILGKLSLGNSSFKKTKDYAGKVYRDPLKRQLPKKILPKEYFDILKEVYKYTI